MHINGYIQFMIIHYTCTLHICPAPTVHGCTYNSFHKISVRYHAKDFPLFLVVNARMSCMDGAIHSHVMVWSTSWVVFTLFANL